ncbi:MAG: hypothetical protein WC794_03840 [Candidatus Doudnabacteria bacterium]|jgi:hypothetical protein
MSKLSSQTKSFIVLFGLAVIGTYLCTMLWPDIASFNFKSYTYQYSPIPKNLDKPIAQAESAPVVDTATWKDYSNTDLGLSFKYKPDWKVKDVITKKDFKIIEIDPGAKFYNIKIYVSPKEFYVMEGLPTKTETIAGKEALNVNDLLYGIKTDTNYYTFDIGLSLSLVPDFMAMVHSVQFQ